MELEDQVKSWMKLDETQATNELLEKEIRYNKPEFYRAKIPGYKKELYLLPVNKKMVSKILKVKQNNEVGLASVGGASGITSMLSRAHQILNPQMTFKD